MAGFLYFSCCSLESFVLVTVRLIEANLAVFSRGRLSSLFLRSFLVFFVASFPYAVQL